MRALVGFGLIILLAVLTLCFNKARAADLGVIGQVYPIAETDLLTLIQKKLKVMQATGEIRAANETLKRRTLAYVNEPVPVIGITHTQIKRTNLFDPTITVSKNIYDQTGQLIVKAGTKVNPLAKMKLHEVLLFIDGSDKREVRWAVSQDKKYKGRDKIILVKGPVINLMKQLKIRLYFDQKGLLTSYFHIKHVPAILFQKGLRLEIDEVKP